MSKTVLTFSGNTAAGVPVGNTAQRPPGAVGYLRYNTDLNEYEGFSEGEWGGLGGGSYQVDVLENGLLVVTDGNLNFNTSATINVSVVANGQNQANVSFSVNTSALGGTSPAAAYAQANAAYAQANLAYTAANSAQTESNTIYAQSNSSYTQANNAYFSANLAYTFANTLVANVSSGNTSNLVISGNSTNVIIDTALTGGGGGSTIVSQETYTVAVANQTIFTLPANASSAAYTLVGRNGILQVPNADYTVTANTTLTLFANCAINDVIDAVVLTSVTFGSLVAGGSNTQVQYNNQGALSGSVALTLNIASNVTSANIVNVSSNLNIQGITNFSTNTGSTTVNGSGVTIDSFPSASYTSVEYTIQLSTSGALHTSKILCMQDGANTYATEYATLLSNNSLGTFSSTLSGSNFNLVYTPTNPTNAVINYNISRMTIIN